MEALAFYWPTTPAAFPMCRNPVLQDILFPIFE